MNKKQSKVSTTLQKIKLDIRILIQNQHLHKVYKNKIYQDITSMIHFRLLHKIKLMLLILIIAQVNFLK